ncbi:MAG: GPW/gp25 family protein [FCB group bacterium]|nr:GPW/gp25 family protein [FCB group bacterium]
MDKRGDLALVRESDCLLQDLRHLLETSPGDLFGSEDYGTKLFGFLGTGDTELNRSLIRRSVERAVASHHRVNPATVQVRIRKYAAEEIQIEIRFIPQDEIHPLNLIYGITVEGGSSFSL